MAPSRLADPTSPAFAVVAGGIAAAILDIAYALAFFGLTRHVDPSRILQSIASGVLGKAAYKGGVAAAALGAALHLGIALVMALAYVAACRVLPTLRRRPWLWGPLYGIGCYLVMNHVVLPLRFGPRPVPPPDVLIGGVLIHMFGVGLPIALLAARARFGRTEAPTAAST